MKGTKSVVSKLKQMQKDLETKPAKAVDKELRTIRNMQRRRIAQNDTFASGELIRGLRVRSVPTTVGSEHTITSEAPHSGFVEFGTGGNTRIGPEHVYWDVERHYRAPSLTRKLVSAIRRWMIIKGISPLTGDMSTSSYLIARSISNESYPGRRSPPGTAAQPFFFEPMMRNEYRLRQAVRNAVRRSIP